MPQLYATWNHLHTHLPIFLVVEYISLFFEFLHILKTIILGDKRILPYKNILPACSNLSHLRNLISLSRKIRLKLMITPCCAGNCANQRHVVLRYRPATFCQPREKQIIFFVSQCGILQAFGAQTCEDSSTHASTMPCRWWICHIFLPRSSRSRVRLPWVGQRLVRSRSSLQSCPGGLMIGCRFQIITTHTKFSERGFQPFVVLFWETVQKCKKWCCRTRDSKISVHWVLPISLAQKITITKRPWISHSCSLMGGYSL